MTLYVTQEELWKQPDGCDYCLQYFIDNKWEYTESESIDTITSWGGNSRDYIYICKLAACVDMYNKTLENGRTIQRIVKISRYLPDGATQPTPIEVIKFNKPKEA